MEYREKVMKEYAVFIIWENGRIYEDVILELIESKFKVLNKIYITWDADKFSENLTSFYETDFRLDCEQINVRGTGEFVVIFVEDNNARYHLQATNRGIEEVNTNVYTLKQYIRNNYTHSYAFHSSINRRECENNIMKLFGNTLDEFISKKMSYEFKLHQNCIGVDGWKSAADILKVINVVTRYVILRGDFYDIPDNYTMRNNGDIDIMVEDFTRVTNVLQPMISRTNNFRFFNWIVMNNEHALVHLKFIGDFYYDEAWQKEIMDTRKLNGKIYIPSDEMLFWSLVYHGCYHKSNYMKYDAILSELAGKLGIQYKCNEEYLSNILADWLRKKGYRCQLHLDGAVCLLNRKNIPKDLIENKPVFYVYKSSYYGRVVNTVIVSKELIRCNAQLFSDTLKGFDGGIYELERHVLPDNSSLYKELEERQKDGEYLWRYTLRYDNVSELVYVHLEDKQGFKRKFISEVSDSEVCEIKYSEEKWIEYISGEPVDSVIRKKYIVGGIESAIQETVNYLKNVFDKFKAVNELSSVAWDMISKNCIIRDGEYVFFDYEAKATKTVTKAELIVYELDHIGSYGIGIDNDEVYFRICEMLNVEPGNYRQIIEQKRLTVENILGAPLNRSINAYMRYINIPLSYYENESSIATEKCQILEKELKKLQKNTEMLYRSNKLDCFFLDVEHAQIIATNYFQSRGIKRVAVYGVGKYGKLLLSLLRKISCIIIVGCVDQKVTDYEDYQIVKDYRSLEPFDLLIISPINYEVLIDRMKLAGIGNVTALYDLV